MRIEIHAIQNHSPANLNRDDLGAPKTCYFGGVIRTRISSQCIKRSIRLSEEFREVGGAVRTRRLAELIAGGLERGSVDPKLCARAETVLAECGFASKTKDGGPTNMLVYTSKEGIRDLARVLKEAKGSDSDLARRFAEVLAEKVSVPDIALSGRMLEPVKDSDAAKQAWKGLDTTVEAALQVAHAISTHEARPEIDYYVAADDIPGADAGAGYIDEAQFASACFYKYFSIDWEQLVTNLKGDRSLASDVIARFVRAAVLTNPTGKQNSFAAHNPPAGVLVEIRTTPLSHANAFAEPISSGERSVISQSIAQLAQHINDMDVGYGTPKARIWFSPNRRYPLQVVEKNKIRELVPDGCFVSSLDELVKAVTNLGAPILLNEGSFRSSSKAAT